MEQYINKAALVREMKEVNLEREIGIFTTKFLLKKRNHSTSVFHLTQNNIDDIAKHFYELGMQGKENNREKN